MKKFKSALRTMGMGLFRTLWGTGVSAAMAFAGYGFVMIPSEGGYIAVVDFLLATIALVIALGAMYIMGGNNKKGGKK